MGDARREGVGDLEIGCEPTVAEAPALHAVTRSADEKARAASHRGRRGIRQRIPGCRAMVSPLALRLEARTTSQRASRGGLSLEYTHLGRFGVVVSRLCLGTMNFGPHTSEEDSHKIMDVALGHG